MRICEPVRGEDEVSTEVPRILSWQSRVESLLREIVPSVQNVP